MTKTDWLMVLQTQEMGVTVRWGVCGGVGPNEGHLEKGYGGRTLTGWGSVVLLVEDILINGTREKCSHIEMFTF